MRLPATAHTSHPWRIHDLTPDFRVEDVWALPTPGDRGDLPRLVAQFADNDFPRGSPLLVRVLWAARWKLGALLGWDSPEAGLHTRVTTLRNQLPRDLRDARPAPKIGPFTPLYLLDDEYAAEIANRTVHAVLHLGWVRDGSGGYRGQMAVLVKPNGPLGAGYMAAIRPLRQVLVYPALLASMQRSWQAEQAPGAAEPREEPLMHRNEAAALLGRLHHAQNDLYQGGEPAELRDILTADIAWHVPGDNAIAGDYHGHDEVLGYMLKRRNLAAATMHIQPRELLVGDGDYVAARADGTATIGGVDHSWSTIGLYRVREGKIAECWLLPLDAIAFDTIWRA
jgi:ketosteroid isomerase-like protein